MHGLWLDPSWELGEKNNYKTNYGYNLETLHIGCVLNNLRETPYPSMLRHTWSSSVGTHNFKWFSAHTHHTPYLERRPTWLGVHSTESRWRVLWSLLHAPSNLWTLEHFYTKALEEVTTKSWSADNHILCGEKLCLFGGPEGLLFHWCLNASFWPLSDGLLFTLGSGSWNLTGVHALLFSLKQFRENLIEFLLVWPCYQVTSTFSVFFVYFLLSTTIKSITIIIFSCLHTSNCDV